MPGSVLKSYARKLIFENFPGILLISLTYVFFVTAVYWLSVRLPGNISWQDILDRISSGEIIGPGIIYTNFKPGGIFPAVILLLLQPVLDVGFISYCLKIIREQNTEFKDIFDGFHLLLKVISVFITTTVLVILWSILLIIPGIIASYRYRLAYYILLDDPDKGVLQCITESKLLMHGKKLDLFIIDFSFIGWYILDGILLLLIPLPFMIPVISIWISPYTGLTRTAFYEERIATAAV